MGLVFLFFFFFSRNILSALVELLSIVKNWSYSGIKQKGGLS